MDKHIAELNAGAPVAIMPPMPDKLITTARAAEILDLDASRVRQLARSGELAAERFGRDWMFNEDAVRAYKRRKPGPTPRTPPPS